MEAIRLAQIDSPVFRMAHRRRRQRQFDALAFLRPLAVLLAAALLLCGGWLMFRRLSGAFLEPLSGGMLVATGLLAALCAAGARLMWKHAANTQGDSRLHYAMEWLPTVALVLVATSAALPGSSIAAAILLCAVIAAEECGAALIGRLPPRGHSAIAKVARRPSGARSHLRVQRQGVVEIQHEAPSASVWQQFTRERSAESLETIHGTFRCRFAVGQRTAVEHLVFCPMLAGVPHVSAAALDELDCSVRATHVYRYGARLEIRLGEPCDEPFEVLVEYEARG